MNQKKQIVFRALTAITLVLALASCNIYSKFGSTGSDEGKTEEALKFLQQNPPDYDGAIEQYSALSDTNEKNRHLCQVNLARAGLTLPVLINDLGSGGGDATAIGDLATAILPWTQEKQTAVEAAAAPCDAYIAAAPTLQFAKILQTLSGLMDCAVRLARTDQFVARSNGDTTCTTAGNNDGAVTRADVSDQTNGTITTSGMCTADAVACKNRIVSTGGVTSGDTDVDGLAGQLTTLTGFATGDAIRNFLRTKVAP